MSILVSASVLSADMLNLENEIKKLETNGIDMLHFDVMDGIFVKNITYGLPILAAVDKVTDMPLDVHLMITDPYIYVKRFAEAGADIITFHLESQSDAMKTIEAVKECGVKAAVSVRPGTPVEEVYPFLPYVDMVLVMTVEPGFGGQSFIPETLEKIRKLREKIDASGRNIGLQVDGGINAKTAGLVIDAGADILVSGSYLFNADNMTDAAKLLREGNIC